MAILLNYNDGRMDRLRSLKYSEFSGKEPYIQKPEGFSYNQLNARTTDLERFAKIVTSKPGLKFQTNQALLQQVDAVDKLKKGATGGFKNLAKAVGKQLVKTVTNNVTTTASILAQVPVNGTGTHFIKGLTPSGYLQSGAPRTTGLGNFLATQGIGGGVNGAKSALAGQIIPTNIESVLEGSQSETTLSREAEAAAGNVNQLASTALSRLNSFTPNIGAVGKNLFGNNLRVGAPPLLTNKLNSYREYLGSEITTGPAVGRSGQSPSPKVISNQVAKERGEMERLYEQGTVTSQVSGETNIFPQQTRDSIKYKLSDGQTYLTSPLNIQNRLKLGDQGNKNSLGVDEINKLESSTESLLGDQAVDIIPFEFNIFEPGNERFLYFRAHLDSLNDNYNGNWNGTKYIGRAEQFYTYEGFERTINFSFKIAAFSKEELVPLYKKLNFLVGSTAPTYSSNGEFMKGTLVAITIGDYIGNLDGFISNISLAWQKEYPWEIDLEELTYPVVPHILDVSVNFTPIHKFNVKSNITPGAENYIGGRNNFIPKVQTLPTLTQPLAPIPTVGPTATNIGPSNPLSNTARTIPRGITPIQPAPIPTGGSNASDLFNRFRG